MMNLLAALRSQSTIFEGTGTNHEAEDFVGRLELQPLVNGSALMLHYTATRTDGKHLHQEATLLATGADGALCLWPMPGGVFAARSSCTLRAIAP